MNTYSQGGFQHASLLRLVIVLAILMSTDAMWDRSFAAPLSAAKNCDMRVSQEDVLEYFTHATSRSQRLLLTAIVAGDINGAVKTIPKVTNVNFLVPGNTWLLSRAVQSGSAVLIKALMAAGADPTRTDCVGWSAILYLPLDRAIAKNPSDEELEAMANMLTTGGRDLDGADNAPARARLLTTAAKYGHIDFMKWMLAHGAEVNSDVNGTTALIASVERKQTSCVRALLETGANPNQEDRYMNTPLLAAVNVGDLQLVKLLINHGANVNEARAAGTPLGTAKGRIIRAKQSSTSSSELAVDEDIVSVLVQAGAKK